MNHRTTIGHLGNLITSETKIVAAIEFLNKSGMTVGVGQNGHLCAKCNIIG